MKTRVPATPYPRVPGPRSGRSFAAADGPVTLQGPGGPARAAHQPRDVGHLLRGHQPGGRRRPLRRAREEPLVRVPDDGDDGLVQGEPDDGERARRRSPSTRPASAREPPLPAPAERGHGSVRRVERGLPGHGLPQGRDLRLLGRPAHRGGIAAGDGRAGGLGRLDAGERPPRGRLLGVEAAQAVARAERHGSEEPAERDPGRGGHGRDRHGLALPAQDLEGPPRRPARGHGADARRPPARASCASPAAASSRARGSTCATSGRRRSGPIEDRELLVNRWNYEFKHRPTPDYYQTFGLGFFEYFQLAEDIGAEPLPILGCGMACQFNSGELVPLDAARSLHPGGARPDRVRERRR